MHWCSYRSIMAKICAQLWFPHEYFGSVLVALHWFISSLSEDQWLKRSCRCMPWNARCNFRPGIRSRPNPVLTFGFPHNAWRDLTCFAVLLGLFAVTTTFNRCLEAALASDRKNTTFREIMYFVTLSASCRHRHLTMVRIVNCIAMDRHPCQASEVSWVTIVS